MRRALISVFDKTGLEDLVRGLADAGVELVSTGGSAALIAGLGLPVTRVEERPVGFGRMPRKGESAAVNVPSAAEVPAVRAQLQRFPS